MTTQQASEEVAFWELDLENEGQPVPVSHSVQPCIRTSGIVDIGIFEDQEDVRIPVNEVDVKPGGKYHGSYASLPPQLPSPPSKPPKADRLKNLWMQQSWSFSPDSELRKPGPRLRGGYSRTISWSPLLTASTITVNEQQASECASVIVQKAQRTPIFLPPLSNDSSIESHCRSSGSLPRLSHTTWHSYS